MLMLFNKFWQFYCILTELIQNVVVLVPCLRRWEGKKKKKKKRFSFFWPAGILSQLAGKGTELLQEKKNKKTNPACVQQTGCGPSVPLQNSMRSAWEQAETRCKAQKYNTNKKQINGQDNHNPEICPYLCLYFLTQQFQSMQCGTFPKASRTHGREEQLGFSCSSLSLYDAAAAIHTVVKAPLRYQMTSNTVASVGHCCRYFMATYFTSECGQRCDYHQSRAWAVFFIPVFYFTRAFLCDMLVCTERCFFL